METKYIMLAGLIVFILVDYFWKKSYSRTKELRENVAEKLLMIQEILLKGNIEGAAYEIKKLSEECSDMKSSVFALSESEHIRKISKILKEKNGWKFDFPSISLWSWELSFDGQLQSSTYYDSLCLPPAPESNYSKEIEKILREYFNIK